MIMRFSIFLHRYFWFVLFVICGVLSGPATKKTAPLLFDTAKWNQSERFVYEKLQGLSEDDIRALNVMARTVYGETRNQHHTARTAVAHVILNRSKNNATNIPKVIFKRKQFTCWDDHNRSIILAASTRDKAFLQSFSACVCAIKAKTDITHGADHYHATYIKPYWKNSKRLKNVGRFGSHIFYKRASKAL